MSAPPTGAFGALAAAPAAAAEEAGWSTLFSVSPGLMIWTLLVFGTLMFVLRRFAWPPLMAALDAREKGIQDAIDEAARQRGEAEELLARQREQMAQGRREAQALVAESRAAAETLRKELEAKARDEARAMVESARREIERERLKAVESVRREAVDVALAAAARLVGERLDSDRDRRLAAQYIAELADTRAA